MRPVRYCPECGAILGEITTYTELDHYTLDVYEIVGAFCPKCESYISEDDWLTHPVYFRICSIDWQDQDCSGHCEGW